MIINQGKVFLAVYSPIRSAVPKPIATKTIIKPIFAKSLVKVQPTLTKGLSVNLTPIKEGLITHPNNSPAIPNIKLEIKTKI